MNIILANCFLMENFGEILGDRLLLRWVTKKPWNCHWYCDKAKARCVRHQCFSWWPWWPWWSWQRAVVALTCCPGWPAGGRGPACWTESDPRGQHHSENKQGLCSRALTSTRCLPVTIQSFWTSWHQQQGRQGWACWTGRDRGQGDRSCRRGRQGHRSHQGGRRQGGPLQECLPPPYQTGDFHPVQPIIWSRTGCVGTSATLWGRKMICWSSWYQVSLLKSQGAIWYKCKMA